MLMRFTQALLISMLSSTLVSIVKARRHINQAKSTQLLYETPHRHNLLAVQDSLGITIIVWHIAYEARSLEECVED